MEAFQELICEVVFHPSYTACDTGEFILQVHGGNTVNLQCTAKFGAPQVQFVDRRVLFDNVPLNMTTTRTAVLYNPSQNHAFFQVTPPNKILDRWTGSNLKTADMRMNSRTVVEWLPRCLWNDITLRYTSWENWFQSCSVVCLIREMVIHRKSIKTVYSWTV